MGETFGEAVEAVDVGFDDGAGGDEAAGEGECFGVAVSYWSGFCFRLGLDVQKLLPQCVGGFLFCCVAESCDDFTVFLGIVHHHGGVFVVFNDL